MRKTKEKRLLTIWLPPFFLALFIFIMSSFRATDSDQQSGIIVDLVTTLFPNLENTRSLVVIIRKTAHFIEYAFLGFLTARGFNFSKKSPWLSVLACGFYAATDEFHQTFVPGRSGEINDVLLDTAGATFGAFIYFLLNRKSY